MARFERDGYGIVYELIGTGPKLITITPGGRFSKDTPGVRELGQELAAAGYTALIWDRLNCGESDVCFSGECESFQNADSLAALIRHVGLGPALIFGASGGARESLLVPVRHPEVVAGAMVQWLSGGAIGIATLPISYYASSVMAAAFGGMAAVVELPEWEEPIRRNPANRGRMLAMDPESFIALLRAWSEYFMPQPGIPMPCVSREDLSGILAPVTILRSGASDFHHSRETSELVAQMIPGAKLDEPPWSDREWILQLDHALKNGGGLFSRIPLVAPQLRKFASEIGF